MQGYHIGELSIGDQPRVVGVISRRDTLARGPLSQDLPCDFVEVRLDQIGVDTPGWLEQASSFEAAGLPVILTLRLAAEGGGWNADDSLRMDTLTLAMGKLSTVDVEFNSEIRAEVCKMAGAQGKNVIVSYHNFQRTPPLDELSYIVREISKSSSAVPKITTMVSSPSDVETLRTLLLSVDDRPICVLGMGDRGTATRIAFARDGSCLTYGYLDRSSAPGQLSCEELKNRLLCGR